MSKILSVRGLEYRYDDGTDALRGVSFDLNDGESLALLGPNGGGKTTLLLSLIGVLSARGDVEVDGLLLVPANFRAIRRKIGFLFQDPDDQLFLPTVREDVAFAPRQAGLSEAEAYRLADEALARVELTAAAFRPPYLLSAGQKQRAALAGLLAAQARILVLDEPTTHLDPPSRRQLIELLASLPQSKIVVTHDAAFARALAARAIFLEAGRIAADGPIGDIVSRFHWDLEFRRSVSPDPH